MLVITAACAAILVPPAAADHGDVQCCATVPVTATLTPSDPREVRTQWANPAGYGTWQLILGEGLDSAGRVTLGAQGHHRAWGLSRSTDWTGYHGFRQDFYFQVQFTCDYLFGCPPNNWGHRLLSRAVFVDYPVAPPPPPPPPPPLPPGGGEPFTFQPATDILEPAREGRRYQHAFCQYRHGNWRSGPARGRLCGSPLGRRPEIPSGGNPPYSFRLKIGRGHLPRGLVLNTNTGWLRGVPARGTGRPGMVVGRTTFRKYRFVVCAYERTNLHRGICRRFQLEVMHVRRGR